MKKLRFLCLFLLIGSTVAAQRQNRYFMKNDGQQVELRDSADYLRIVKEPEEGSKLYIVNEYYLDGTTKSLGHSREIDPPVYEGQYISYYKNGKKQMVANYKKGKLTDTVFRYYPNGKLYTVIGYQTTSDGKVSKYLSRVKDSIGNDLVVNGNGRCVFYTNDFKAVSVRGTVKNGKYEGEWFGGESTEKLIYKEIYADGELISGENFDKDGTIYKYTKERIEPQFKGGIDKFYTYLKKTVRYPAVCYRNRIQGVVRVSFTVMKDGSVKNPKVLNRSVHPELAREALRVIAVSPDWEPGYFRGKVANVKYTVPVSFTLR